MRLRVLSVVLLCSGAAAVWACSLNPQPLPPDTTDASTGFDGMVQGSPDGGGGMDAGSTDDAQTPKGDAASTDAATDAASDASEDASDASDSDAIADAGEGG